MNKTVEKRLKKIADMALAQAKKLGATEAEVVLWDGSEELTRFANSMIHQSIVLKDSLVHVRVILGKKQGVSRTNQLDESSVSEAVKTAVDVAKLQPDDPNFHALPEPAEYEKVHEKYEHVKHIGALGRARAIDHIIEAGEKYGLHASGAFSEQEGVTAVANSHGVWATHSGKSSSLTTILTGDKGSGFGSHSAKSGEEIDYKNVADVAVYKATHGEFVEVPAGEYEVILEPPAVAELLDFFGWLGPNARIYHEDVSFYQNNLGKQLFHESLHIQDDPLHEGGYPLGFDFEGTPKQKVNLVEGGKPSGVVYDSYHAHKYKQPNTGHAQLSPNTFGPVPTHIVVSPGNKTLEELVKNVKKGLLVTRFWYTRVVQHKQLTLTGMTRDGTFYIEDGKILGRVKNLRYTQSVIEALQDIRGIGKNLELVGSEGSPSLVPTLHLGKFRFTGVTEHR